MGGVRCKSPEAFKVTQKTPDFKSSRWDAVSVYSVRTWQRLEKSEANDSITEPVLVNRDKQYHETSFVTICNFRQECKPLWQVHVLPAWVEHLI